MYRRLALEDLPIPISFFMSDTQFILWDPSYLAHLDVFTCDSTEPLKPFVNFWRRSKWGIYFR